jgi:hypothetical protein
LARILVGALVLIAATSVTGAQAPQGQWRDSPAYLGLFAPRGARRAAYRIYVSPLDLRTALRNLATDSSLLHPPGAWSPAAVLAQDAFGQTGSYDRAKLARLYAARRAEVARGPRASGGGTSEAWTLISPYPTEGMERLEPGTMLIVLDLKFP